MKKLVCASEIKAAAAKGEKVFCIDSGTIITPSARDLANELGVEFITDSIAATGSVSSGGGQQRQNNRKQEIDRDIIYQVVKAVLASRHLTGALAPSPEAPFAAEYEPQSGLKIVRGRTVAFEPFDTGKPGTDVSYREVVGKDEAKMSAGFLTIDKSSFGWELCYEEIDIILEGSLSVTINGETYQACQGDVLFVPKGSKVTWSSAGHVKLFYVTYPANWSDLMA